MSDTPITDAAFWEHEEFGEQIVDADFARRLERDRAELIEALEKFIKLYGKDNIEDWMALRDNARALLTRMKEAK